ncbi:MAG TPA: acyl-CoA dehydrogenase family protein [Candidatus Baltobacteraceae bacterium]|nr:acyl-CoA dehydrogenase family protein [Candidatus Baltobacteraceae bacterium]
MARFFRWPFFEERHRAFAAGLAAWLKGSPSPPGLSEDTAVRRWVRELGNGGWLQPCTTHDVRALCIARQTLAQHDALADFAFAMQGLSAGPIVLFGTGEQRKRYVEPLARGATIGAFAITEPQAGSDVSALAARARREGDHYILSGIKTYISNAGIADVYVVFARTSDDGARGISAFLVDAGTTGLTALTDIETIAPHPIGTLELKEARIPAGARIGEEGQGFKIAMATLDVFRATVGAAAVGFALHAFEETLAHVRSRRLFGRTLAQMQLTQSRIAEMATEIDAAALLVYRAAYERDTGGRVTREAAMAKWFATEAASRVADAAVQLLGAKGVTRGQAVEQIYRDVRALRIYEGASEIQQLIIARSILEQEEA